MRPSLIPFLKYANNRRLREKLWRAYAGRGLDKETNNREVVLETVRLRHERATLLGFNSHADYSLSKKNGSDSRQSDELFRESTYGL